MKILVLTGTRADFGKIKEVIVKLNALSHIDLSIFVTGMHMLKLYGNTHKEIDKLSVKQVYKYINQNETSNMSEILSSSILGLSNYIQENNQDLVIVHGDRIEALAGSIVGSLENIHVLHLEGGERSGTIDESIRHAITKFSHLHFVVNSDAEKRLRQLGETNIYKVGSSNIDIMLSTKLPTLNEVKNHYAIDFDSYAILIFHPVTTENNIKDQIDEVLNACKISSYNFVVIMPNNDKGSHHIVEQYLALDSQFRLLPSMRFEYYLTLLKNAKMIVGNSSSGIHEAPVYGVPTINIGSRQKNRANFESILNCKANAKDILKQMRVAKMKGHFNENYTNGDGNSAKKIVDIIKDLELANISIQKTFKDIE